MGGLDYIFLTHRDDVSDARKYAARFGAERVIHELERAAQPDAEIILERADEHQVGSARLLFTPGHTAGHMVLLWRVYICLSAIISRHARSVGIRGASKSSPPGNLRP